MDHKHVSLDKEILNSESEDEDSKDPRGCASSYLVDERKNPKFSLPQKFREKWSKAALALAIVSLLAAIGFSLASFITSQKTESSSVFAAGFDAFFAAINVLAVCWRFRDELNGTIGPTREKIATTIIAVTFVLGGIATVVISLYHLKENDHPKNTGEMLIVLAVGFAMYSVLAASQFQVSGVLKSPSMRALAVDSALACAMSLGLLASAWIYREHGNLWYLDHVVATLLGVVSLVYGIVLGVEVQEFKIKQKLGEAFRQDF